MKKRFLSALLSLVLCLSLLPSALAARGDVHYIDADGNEASASDAHIVKNDATTWQGVSATWYCVENKITSTHDSVTVKPYGDEMNLILADDLYTSDNTFFAHSILTINLILTDNVTLNVFGQTDNTGTLNLKGLSGQGKLVLYGGTFIGLPADHYKLGQGRCFRTGTAGNYKYSKTPPADSTTPATVVPCPHPTLSSGVCTLCRGVPYRAYNPTTKKFETKACSDYTVIDNSDSDANYSGGWLVVTGNTTINGTPVFSGAVNLILCDGATLTVSDGLRANGNLTIYGQTNGTGKLAVTNSSYSPHGHEYFAMYMDSNALTVHGGNITATVATETDTYVLNSYGIYTDSFTVYGGTVTGTAGAATNNSYGIHAQTMTVSGGTVTATGGTAGGNSYGIYANKSLTVSGGTVKATGGDTEENGDSYGISASNMSVSGGTVNGTGGTADGSGGIYASSVTVSGGTVNAVGGTANISCGLAAQNITVSGGTLKLTEGSSVSTKLAVENTVTLADLLADGCAYQLYDADEPSKLEELHAPLTCGVYVVTHDHEYGEDEKCVYCGKNKPKESKYAITLTTPTNGTLSSDGKKAQAGKTVTLTVKPDEGYELDSLTVLTTKSRELDLIDNEDGTYSFTMPRSAVTVEATFTATEVEPEPEPTPSPSFSDVPPDSWFAPAVSWAVEKGITTGTSAATFAPTLSCTRAELVTFLWRAAGSPEAGSPSPFEDAPSDAFYAPALAWAYEQNLVKGSGNNLFYPNSLISRQETVTILYRLAQSNGDGFSAAWAFRMPFDDIDQIADWAWEAVCWCYKENILQGFDNKIMPNATCTRSEIVTMLFRFLEK